MPGGYVPEDRDRPNFTPLRGRFEGRTNRCAIRRYGIIYIFMANEPSFEWDNTKDRLNRVRHGVSFAAAQTAFLDPARGLAQDLEHSGTERRYFCFGRVGEGVMTVRFTVRAGRIRIFGAGYWRKGKRIYEQQNG